MGELPDDPQALLEWMSAGVRDVGESYANYLEERASGAGRRYFRSKGHAFFFLKSVAPTKLADGAWLHGLLSRWQDPRFGNLIETYLEELGDGDPSKNHVLLYKKLLLSHGCNAWGDLSDEHFVQGAIQLSMAYNAETFLPEIIGYNLGYEQLPLHLLITAYELKELKVDPYYFTLHITVDNADSGHARKAVDAVFDAMPHVGDSAEWYERIRSGYALNFLGTSTLTAIEEFDLDDEIVEIFRGKCEVGQFMHDHAGSVGGRSMNSWLSDPNSMHELLQALVNDGWIKRNQDPLKSRFWSLIQGKQPRMFGVFSAYEQQIIYDWIAGESLNHNVKLGAPSDRETVGGIRDQLRHPATFDPSRDSGDFGAEERELDEMLEQESQTDTLKFMIELMSPALHHTASGLKATRLFKEIYR